MPDTHPCVKSVIENCQKDSSWVVMLKWDKIEEVKVKLQKNCTLVGSVGTFILKYKYENMAISFYKNGKIIITNVEDIDSAINNILG
ncbi:MAG: hypothetical protein ACTSQE_05535 [Candidatus Heimdallarchaeaceae archaeon]